MYFVYTLCIIFCMYVIQGLKLSFGSTRQLSKWCSGCTRPDTFSLAKYTPPSTKSNQIKQTTGSNCAVVVIFYSVYCNFHSANAKLFDITTDLVSLKSFLGIWLIVRHYSIMLTQQRHCPPQDLIRLFIVLIDDLPKISNFKDEKAIKTLTFNLTSIVRLINKLTLQFLLCV